jgi:hypothetical protein
VKEIRDLRVFGPLLREPDDVSPFQGFLYIVCLLHPRPSEASDLGYRICPFQGLLNSTKGA